MEAIPWNNNVSPKAFVSFSSPRSSTRRMDLREAKHAIANPKTHAKPTKVLNELRNGTAAVAIPIIVTDALLRNKTLISGLVRL